MNRARYRAIRTFVVFWLPGGMLWNFILLFFVDGKRTITVVDKHLKHRASRNNTRPEATSCREYVVDVRIGRKKGIRALYCSLSAFKKLRTGRQYEVYLRRNELKSIEKDLSREEQKNTVSQKVINGMKMRSVAMSISAAMAMPMGDQERLEEALGSREDNPDNTIKMDNDTADYPDDMIESDI